MVEVALQIQFSLRLLYLIATIFYYCAEAIFYQVKMEYYFRYFLSSQHICQVNFVYSR